jgi:hypothetical protein
LFSRGHPSPFFISSTSTDRGYWKLRDELPSLQVSYVSELKAATPLATTGTNNRTITDATGVYAVSTLAMAYLHPILTVSQGSQQSLETGVLIDIAPMLMTYTAQFSLLCCCCEFGLICHSAPMSLCCNLETETSRPTESHEVATPTIPRQARSHLLSHRSFLTN